MAQQPNVPDDKLCLWHFFEVMEYPHLKDPMIREGMPSNNSMCEWITKDLSLEDISDGTFHQPIGGLRLIVRGGGLAFTPGETQYLEHQIGLPSLTFDQCCRNNTTAVFHFPSPRTDYGDLGIPFKSPTLLIRPNVDGLLITTDGLRNLLVNFYMGINEKSKIATAVLLYSQHISNPVNVNEYIMDQLKQKADVCTSPLLLPLVMFTLSTLVVRSSLDFLFLVIRNIMHQTGQHHFQDVAVANPLDIDFLAATRDLNHASQDAVHNVFRMKSMLLVLDGLRNFDSYMRNKISNDNDSVARKKVTDIGRAFWKARLDNMEADCQALLLTAELYDKRITTLIEVVYQYMAQKDAKVNIELAGSSAAIAKASKEDSAAMREIALQTKRDSSAMKTIAILGIFFLPGTFVAAIFSMPAIGWEGNGFPALNSGFKYYWAITIPLTFVVLVIWALSILLPWRKWLAKFKTSRRILDEEVGLEAKTK